MTNELSLEEMLRLGKRVRRWERWEAKPFGSDCYYDGHYKGLEVTIQGDPASTRYWLSACLEGLQLGNYGHVPEHKNRVVKEFYDAVKSKHEKAARKCAWKRLGVTDKPTLDELVKIAKKLRGWDKHYSRDNTYSHESYLIYSCSYKGIYFGVRIKPHYFIRVEFEGIPLVSYSDNNSAIKKLHEYLETRDESLVTSGAKWIEPHEKAIIKRVKELAK